MIGKQKDGSFPVFSAQAFLETKTIVSPICMKDIEKANIILTYDYC